MPHAPLTRCLNPLRRASVPHLLLPLLRRVALLVPAALLAACGGIPLGSLPKAARLPSALAEGPLDEFRVAVQLDTRAVPPPTSVPMLSIALRPAEAGAFVPIEDKLPMRVVTGSAATLGLPAPSGDRRWLIYSLPPETQAEVQCVRDYVKRLKAKNDSRFKGSLSIGISQEGMAKDDPALANMRWETWVQTTKAEGFFALWSGTIADLRKAGGASSRPEAPSASTGNAAVPSPSPQRCPRS